jgi:hypothetical protein
VRHSYIRNLDSSLGVESCLKSRSRSGKICAAVRRLWGPSVRIDDDYRKSVVFFGYPDSTPGRGGILCIGTGFLVWYDGIGYLVTAKHVSHQLGQDPFLIRINRKGGAAENIPVDGMVWLEHPDSTVDVAAVLMHIPSTSEYDVLYMDADRMFTRAAHRTLENIGVGSLTYTIGLFSLLTGEKRNLPICHHGNVALLPSDERVPCIDWNDPHGKKRVKVEAFLVEAQSLALQLPFCFEVRTLSDRLVSSAPE